MRGFGVTGADFAIESHMDVVANELGIDPIELRLINAYRDGDMKAHRREAKNCALIECCQVATQKAEWRIGEQFMQMSSMLGGGGERAAIPPTVTDENGRIGERRSRRVASGRTGIRQPAPPQPSPAPPQPTRPAAAPPPPPSTMPPHPAATPPASQPIYTHPAAGPVYTPAGGRPQQPPPQPPAPVSSPPAGSESPGGRPIGRPGYSRFASNSGFRRR
jgi:hypothetical protein